MTTGSRRMVRTTAVEAVSVYCFPARTSMRVAARLGSLVREDGHEVEVHDMTVLSREPAEAAKLVILVLPVLGHERIPPVVERWISQHDRLPGWNAICLTADVRRTDSHPVADETERMMLGRGSSPRARPLIIDTPYDDSDPGERMSAWVRELLGGEPLPPRRSATSNAASSEATLPDDPDVRRVAGILGATPQTRSDSTGRCVSLALVDRAPYPRSLLDCLDRSTLDRLFEALTTMPALRSLSIAYAGLVDLPEMPSSLRELDLTCNPVKDLSALTACPLLERLHLVGCELTDVPEPLEDLPNLETLFIAKNSIERLPAGLGRLKRLTLYRNLVTQLPTEFHRASTLEALSLGANPMTLDDESLVGMDELEVLGLRGLRLTRLPAGLFRLPRLRVVDVSKNDLEPMLLPAGTQFTLTDHMPAEAWQ